MLLNCWSLRCSWSIACRRCSNYIFILNLTPGFNGLGKDNYKMRREALKFWNWVCLIFETLRYLYLGTASQLTYDLGCSGERGDWTVPRRTDHRSYQNEVWITTPNFAHEKLLITWYQHNRASLWKIGIFGVLKIHRARNYEWGTALGTENFKGKLW